MSGAIEVHTPCRLHFGMFSFGRTDRPQFGGVGAMIEPPGVTVRIEPAARFEARGALPERARRFVELVVANWNLDTSPACAIEVRSPRSHTGLGTGTQLGLAIAAGLRRFLQLPELSADELAASVNRGMRSAIGTHGFLHGGFVVDAGKGPGDSLGKLAARVTLPDEWRFVLICPTEAQGLAGASEATAFAQLPPVPDEVTRELWAITDQQMLPAIERSDCASFGEAVYRFGRLAGQCFAAVQGGSFANDQIRQLVEALRGQGVPGVGQSSWGPTVFAIVANEADVQRVVGWIRDEKFASSYDVVVARANNCGARIEEVA